MPAARQRCWRHDDHDDVDRWDILIGVVMPMLRRSPGLPDSRRRLAESTPLLADRQAWADRASKIDWSVVVIVALILVIAMAVNVPLAYRFGGIARSFPGVRFSVATM